MLKEAIETIVNLAGKASAATILQSPLLPRGGYLVHNGKADPLSLPPPLRAHTVYTAEDLAAAAKTIATKPAIFHAPDQVVLLLDSDDRRERMTMPLTLASTFQVLQGLEETYLFQPKQLARLLKLDLAGTNYPDEIVRGLKRLKWKTQSELRQGFDHDRESIGKDVEAEMTADVELPEYVVIESAVYSNPGEDFGYEIRCLLDPQPLDQKIAFRPVPGELEEALQNAQIALRERLAAALPEVPIFHGTP